MPFTCAHPVAVLPLRRLGLPLSALAVGSMAPDFEYLVRLALRGEIGHTAFGQLTFCLPAGLLVLWLYQRVWQPPLLALFAKDPQPSPERRFSFWPLGRAATLAVAILAGSLTHVAWDSFTHTIMS